MTWEGNFLLWLQEHVRSESATSLVRTVSHTVDKGGIWFALAGGMCLFKKTRKAGMLGLLSMGAEFLLVNVALKNLVGRERPFQEVDGLEILCHRPHDYSFPSGHTAVSFAAATAVLLGGYKKWGTLFMVYATLVGFSRMYLGVHYPTDVLAGALIGSSSAMAVRFIYALIEREKRNYPALLSG